MPLTTLPPGGGFTSVSCISDTFCVASGGGTSGSGTSLTSGSGVAVSWDGAAWSDPSVYYPAPAGATVTAPVLPAISCTSGPSCVIVDGSGHLSEGDGTHWSAPNPIAAGARRFPPIRRTPAPEAPIPDPPPFPVRRPALCGLVDNTGHTYTLRNGSWSGLPVLRRAGRRQWFDGVALSVRSCGNLVSDQLVLHGGGRRVGARLGRIFLDSGAVSMDVIVAAGIIGHGHLLPAHRPVPDRERYRGVVAHRRIRMVPPTEHRPTRRARRNLLCHPVVLCRHRPGRGRRAVERNRMVGAPASHSRRQRVPGDRDLGDLSLGTVLHDPQQRRRLRHLLGTGCSLSTPRTCVSPRRDSPPTIGPRERRSGMDQVAPGLSGTGGRRLCHHQSAGGAPTGGRWHLRTGTGLGGTDRRPVRPGHHRSRPGAARPATAAGRTQWFAFVHACQSATDDRAVISFPILVVSLGIALLGAVVVGRKSRRARRGRPGRMTRIHLRVDACARAVSYCMAHGRPTWSPFANSGWWRSRPDAPRDRSC